MKKRSFVIALMLMVAFMMSAPYSVLPAAFAGDADADYLSLQPEEIRELDEAWQMDENGEVTQESYAGAGIAETGSSGIASDGAIGSDGTVDPDSGKSDKDKKDKEKKEEDPAAKYPKYKGKNAKRIAVLTYHMVVSNGKKASSKYRNSSLAVSQSTFDKQMKWLKDHGYRTICCEEFYLWHEGKLKLPKKSVLITFDDGASGVADYALPVLKKYKMKGTSFIVGTRTVNNKRGTISYKRYKKLKKNQKYLEFQSHTYGLHHHVSKSGAYEKVKKDIKKQNKYFDFEYLAYPYGYYNSGMIKAYKKSNIKMAFTYGSNGYATRDQSLYKIRRIKVNANESFGKFKSWF